MKLSEIIEQIKIGDLSDETKFAFFNALKRSGSNFLRSQHCRILAYELCEKTLKAFHYAMSLIDYALEVYSNDDLYEKSTLYQIKGVLQFKNKNYDEALICFRKWEQFYVEHFKKIGKEPSSNGYFAALLRAIILRDNFRYSKELEKTYNRSLNESSLAFRNERLYSLVGKMIVSKEKKDVSLFNAALKDAKAIINEKGISRLAFEFRMNKLTDELNVPKEVIRFVINQ